MSEKQKKILIAGVCIAAVLLTMLLLILLVIPSVLKQVFILSYKDLIEKFSYENDIDPYLTCAVIFCESKYKPNALSKAGARGLMQIMPATGQEIADNLGILYEDEILYDPQTSIMFGTYYLRYLMNRFNDNLAVSIAAYNAGPGKASQWLQEYGLNSEGSLRYIPYGETEKYVSKVLKVKKVYEMLYRGVFTAPEKGQEIIYVADNYGTCSSYS